MHVELTLIKLCYLQQAIELIGNQNGVTKKKLIDTVRPVAFKAIPIIEIKNKTQPPGYKVQPENFNTLAEDEGLIRGAKLMIETEKINRPEIITNNGDVIQSKNIEAQPKLPKFNNLVKIRQQVIEQNKEISIRKELSDEELYIAWGLYIDKLGKQNNHSGITNFRSAILKIIDTNNIEIITESNIQQKFIENERASLIEHLQSYFNNRFLTYKVIVVENENNKQQSRQDLSAKQQYLKMIEEYPLVKELKDRLKLSLNF